MAKKAMKGKTAKKKEREKKEEKKEKEKERRERIKERKEEMKNKLKKLNNIKKKRALKNNPYIINKNFMDQLRRDLSVEQKTKREERKEKKREETKEEKREEIKEEKTTTIINNNIIVVSSSSESNSYSNMSKYNFSDVSVPELPTAPPRPLKKYTPSKIPYYNDYINRDFLRKISNLLKKKTFISGDEYSFDDYCLYQKLKIYFEENEKEKEMYPNIKKYMTMIKNVKNLEYKNRVLETFTKKIYKKYKEKRDERESNKKSETSEVISVSDSERELQRLAVTGVMIPPIEKRKKKKRKKKKSKNPSKKKLKS
jgi:hypothetical protein